MFCSRGRLLDILTGCDSSIFEVAHLVNSSLLVALWCFTNSKDVYLLKIITSAVLSKPNHPQITALALLLPAWPGDGSHQGSPSQRQNQSVVCRNLMTRDICRKTTLPCFQTLAEVCIFFSVYTFGCVNSWYWGRFSQSLSCVVPSVVLCSWWGLFSGVET